MLGDRPSNAGHNQPSDLIFNRCRRYPICECFHFTVQPALHDKQLQATRIGTCNLLTTRQRSYTFPSQTRPTTAPCASWHRRVVSCRYGHHRDQRSFHIYVCHHIHRPLIFLYPILAANLAAAAWFHGLLHSW